MVWDDLIYGGLSLWSLGFKLDPLAAIWTLALKELTVGFTIAAFLSFLLMDNPLTTCWQSDGHYRVLWVNEATISFHFNQSWPSVWSSSSLCCYSLSFPKPWVIIVPSITFNGLVTCWKLFTSYLARPQSVVIALFWQSCWPWQPSVEFQ